MYCTVSMDAALQKRSKMLAHAFWGVRRRR
jgi:hypothetical protein